jgi:hypothetical protein
MPAQRFSRFAPLTLIAVGWLAASACPAAAQKPADKERIEEAIQRGTKWLQREQKPSGFWGDGTGAGPGKGWGVGYTALAGLTLAECLKDKEPEDDPDLKRAAAIVRRHAGELEDTYEVALAILFLDRMKAKSDKRLIQWLGGRLIAAQMPSGGWGYKVARHSETATNQLLAALRKVAPPEAKKGEKGAGPGKGPAFDPEKARRAARAALPAGLRALPVLDDPPANLPADPEKKSHDLADATTDNSNTHFAMLGVWTARKYDVPVERTFVLVNRRFRSTQGANGTWSYPFARGAQGGGSTTSVALLGIAIGHVIDPPRGVKPEADPVVLNGLVALSRVVGDPVGDTQNRPEIKEKGGLYFLWAMERIAVLYDIQKLGKKDWYLWGAEILICHQRGDGSWDLDGGYAGQHPVVNTRFALLFLKRANLTPDLSKRLVVDTTALTANVDEKVTPKPPPPPPKVETPVVAVAPPPREVVPKAEPVAQTFAPPAPPSEPIPPPVPAKKSPWPWVVLGVVMVGLLGTGAAFFVMKRKKDDEDEDEKPKKKGKKNANGKAGESKGKKKVRAEVEEEE